MPPVPHTISGQILKGLQECKSVVASTVGSGAGDTVNLYLGGSVQPATSLSVLFTHVSTGETMTTTTDGSGNYSFNLGGMVNTWAVSDAFTITASTITSTALADTAILNGIRPVALVDENGNRHTIDYPLLVQVANDSLPYQNYSESFTYSGTNITSITRTISGVSYVQTLTYNGSNQIIAKSAWVKT